jgi:hypothetical protein
MMGTSIADWPYQPMQSACRRKIISTSRRSTLATADECWTVGGFRDLTFGEPRKSLSVE